MTKRKIENWQICGQAYISTVWYFGEKKIVSAKEWHGCQSKNRKIFSSKGCNSTNYRFLKFGFQTILTNPIAEYKIKSHNFKYSLKVFFNLFAPFRSLLLIWFLGHLMGHCHPHRVAVAPRLISQILPCHLTTSLKALFGEFFGT